MSEIEIKTLVWEVAEKSARKGTGWAQEGVVLREIAQRLTGNESRMPEVGVQQMILDVWHDLFMGKKLGWGHDLDNPNSPFFHVR